MMHKLITQGSSQNRPFKSKIYQGKRREQARNDYNQDRYQNRYRSNSGDRRVSIKVEFSIDRTIEEGHGIIKIIEVTPG